MKSGILIKKMAKEKSIPSSLIFSGTMKEEKKKVAFLLLKSLHCPEENPPCGKCASCISFDKGNNLDFISVKPEEGVIRLRQLEKVKKDLEGRPSISRIKSVWLGDAELMNLRAQNFLLKTLEEPKGERVFILSAFHKNRLLSTIRSRSRIFNFYPEKQIFNFKNNFSFLSSIFRKNEAARFMFCEEIAGKKDKDKKKEKEINYNNSLKFIEMLEEYLRYFLLFFLGVEREESEIAEKYSLPNNYTAEEVAKLLRETGYYRKLLLTTNANPRLILENLVLLL